MSLAGTQLSRGTLLTLEICHPDCWTLEVTADTEAGLLAHAVYDTTDLQGDHNGVRGHFTVFGDSNAELDNLVAAAKDSALTRSIVELKRRYGADHAGSSLGNATRELFVEYDPGNSIADALAAQGFIQEAPVRIRDGTEYWSVFIDDEDRDRLRERLDRIRESEDADISIIKISSQCSSSDDTVGRLSLLTKRQRDVFELACEHGYYDWPRDADTRELAEKADIAKTTLLEHLRTAELKLLDPAIEEAVKSR